MQGLILPVSYRFLLSSLHRRKTWSEITKLRREGNAISVGSHSPHWGRSAPGSQGVSGLWKGPVHCRRREVLQIPNIWEGKKKQTIKSFEKPETLPEAGRRESPALLSSGLPPPCTAGTITASSPGWLFRVDQKNTVTLLSS